MSVPPANPQPSDTAGPALPDGRCRPLGGGAEGDAGGSHCLISIAVRRPSASKLKAIEVMKIITPGKAAIHGCT